MNNIVFSGYVGADAEVKTFDNGGSICQFNIAHTDKGYTTRDGKQIPDRTTWMTVKKNNGEKIAQYLTKGSYVVVQGVIRTDKYEDKYYTSIIAHTIEFGGSKQESQAPQATQGEPQGGDAGNSLPF